MWYKITISRNLLWPRRDTLPKCIHAHDCNCKLPVMLPLNVCCIYVCSAVYIIFLALYFYSHGDCIVLDIAFAFSRYVNTIRACDGNFQNKKAMTTISFTVCHFIHNHTPTLSNISLLYIIQPCSLVLMKIPLLVHVHVIFCKPKQCRPQTWY